MKHILICSAFTANAFNHQLADIDISLSENIQDTF